MQNKKREFKGNAHDQDNDHTPGLTRAQVLRANKKPLVTRKFFVKEYLMVV